MSKPNTIPLNKAMGLTPDMTPDEVIIQWETWRDTYPEDVKLLSPFVVAALNTISVTMDAYNAIISAIPQVEAAYNTAQESYNLALAVLGVGSVQEAVNLAQKALVDLYKQAGELGKTIYTNILVIIQSLVNVDVPEDDIIYSPNVFQNAVSNIENLSNNSILNK